MGPKTKGNAHPLFDNPLIIGHHRHDLHSPLAIDVRRSEIITYGTHAKGAFQVPSLAEHIAGQCSSNVVCSQSRKAAKHFLIRSKDYRYGLVVIIDPIGHPTPHRPAESKQHGAFPKARYIRARETTTTP